MTAHLEEVLVPFVGKVVNQQIAGLAVVDNQEFFEVLSSYLASVLGAYITRVVAGEPKLPASWALEKGGCRQCKLCNDIGKFMEDGQKHVCKARVTETQKQHLDTYFCVFGEYQSFNVEALPIPEHEGQFLWKVTKEYKKFKRKCAEWQKRRDEAQMLLRCIGGGKDMMLLKAYLGDNFDAITSCRVERLPKIFNPIIDRQPGEPATPPRVPTYMKGRVTAHEK